MGTLNYNFVVSTFESNNSTINELYNLLIVESPKKFTSFAEYDDVIKFMVTKYVQFNDYLHSNNLLQIYRVFCLESKRILPDWFKYYSIKIYSKRSIKYYLDNPQKFWEVVYELGSSKDYEYVERLDSLLVDTLEFYKSEYVNYPEYLNTSIKQFTHYYKMNKEYSKTVTEHINELIKLCQSIDKNRVYQIYNSLKSRNILTIEEPELPSGTITQNALNLYTEALTEKKRHEEAEEDFYGDIQLNDEEDRKKKILVVGEGEFVRQPRFLYAIGKVFNVNRDQFELVIEYEKIKTEGERIVNRTQWNDKYIGIIFGPIPHSTSGNFGDNSLITHCQTTEGFPTVVACRANNESGTLKFSKQAFKNALRQIIIDYKSK